MRVHRRHPVEIVIELRDDARHQTASTENLSVGGVFIATQGERPEVGSEVELSLELPGVATPMHCVGRVAWHRERSPKSDAPPGMGVEFEGLGESEIAILRQFLLYGESRRTPPPEDGA
ncbi:MAG: PilZ domain-containing protein [Polyangiaceae bacterium]|nr:PilZ domain-containing protein [Polyangiaceae bacterium]